MSDVPESAPGEITRCLTDWRNGDEKALARLTDEVYRELRRRAGSVMAGQLGKITIQPTALVHELYFQLPKVQHFDWQSRGQFLNVAASMMRNILVDHARKRLALKRGGGAGALLIDMPVNDPALHVDVLLINSALDSFAEQHPRHAKVVELRFFGGLTAEETLDALKAAGIESSLRTIERDWSFARSWLHNAIGSK